MSNEKKSKIGESQEFLQPEPAELDEIRLESVAGGMPRDTKWTYCDQVPTQCYKPNPY